MQTHTNHADSARWAGFRVNPECLNAIKQEAAKRGINEDKLAREFVELIWPFLEAIPSPVCLLASPEMTVAIEAAHAAAIDALFEQFCALSQETTQFQLANVAVEKLRCQPGARSIPARSERQEL